MRLHSLLFKLTTNRVNMLNQRNGINLWNIHGYNSWPSLSVASTKPYCKYYSELIFMNSALWQDFNIFISFILKVSFFIPSQIDDKQHQHSMTPRWNVFISFLIESCYLYEALNKMIPRSVVSIPISIITDVANLHKTSWLGLR